MQHLGGHLEWCHQRNLRPSYITARRRAILLLAAELGDTAPTDATADDLHRWYSDAAMRLAAPSRAVYLSHVACYMRWLVREGHRVDDPTDQLVRPRGRRYQPRPIPADDLARALADAPDRVRPWLVLAAFAGLRAIEIAHLRAEDLRFDMDPPVLLVHEGKGGKSRVVPMHPRVRAELEQLPGRGYVFSHWHGHGPPRPWNVSHGCNKYLHSLGIRSTLHALRHHFISAVYRESLDLRLAQELAGHASPTTTAGYAAWAPHRAAGIVGKL